MKVLKAIFALLLIYCIFYVFSLVSPPFQDFIDKSIEINDIEAVLLILNVLQFLPFIIAALLSISIWKVIVSPSTKNTSSKSTATDEKREVSKTETALLAVAGGISAAKARNLMNKPNIVAPAGTSILEMKSQGITGSEWRVIWVEDDRPSRNTFTISSKSKQRSISRNGKDFSILWPK